VTPGTGTGQSINTGHFCFRPKPEGKKQLAIPSLFNTVITFSSVRSIVGSENEEE